MKLIIITPQKKEEIDIAWVEIESLVGGFVILPGHAPMALTLKPKEKITICLTSGKQETIIPESGTIKVGRKIVELLLTSIK